MSGRPFRIRNAPAKAALEARARASSASGPAQPAASTPVLMPTADLPKQQRASHMPRLPKALREAADVYVATGSTRKFSQAPGLETAARGPDPITHFFSVPGGASSFRPQLAEMVERLAPGDHAPADSDAGSPPVLDDNGISMDWLPKQSRHSLRRAAQHANWMNTVLPKLIVPLLEAKHRQPPSTGAGCTCGNGRKIMVSLAHWDEIRKMPIIICDCATAATQLVNLGYFPCAPLRPSLAFSLPLLEFISIHSLNVAPNSSAWADTLSMFWQTRNMTVDSAESFRKRLSNALHWFQVLQNQAAAHVDLLVEATACSIGSDAARARAQAPGAPQATPRKGKRRRATSDAVKDDERPSSTADSPGNVAEVAVRKSKRLRATVVDVPEEEMTATPGGSGACGLAVDDAGESSVPRAPAAGVLGLDDDGRTAGESGPSRRERPSRLLRSRCPLCFGGDRPTLEYTDAHVLVCLDANFAQKRRKSAQEDPPVQFAGTRFVPRSEVDSMEAEVNRLRQAPRKRRAPAAASRDALPDDVLDECQTSFIAAQEGVVKASKNYYADTGLMALLCRHDRVLWVVNMTTPGERQFYALALLDKLMNELPEDWRVGLLYDIACQLSRSIDKFGYLDKFASRISFAVSVFHAYGHQWACQLVYHPRKRRGFGLTDGEGCERFWSAIRRLIGVLRVTGFFRRLFVLDRQFHFIDSDGMSKFGKWLAKRWRDTMSRLQTAEDALKDCGVPEDVLAKQWEDQRTSQLQPLHRQSKNAGDKAVDKIIVDLAELDNLRALKKQQQAKLRKNAHKLSAHDLERLTIDMDQTIRDMTILKARTKAAGAALGTDSTRRLQELRGSAYLSARVNARVNARALRANIREAVRAHKFERERLERAYRRQVMQNKEHSQTKDLVHRRQKRIGALVRKFNAHVKQMRVLIKQGKVPPAARRARAPRMLDAKQLFKLDVDDDIWQEDPGLGPQDERDLPRWQVEEGVQNGIRALLELQRCREELERVTAEADALARWWDEERAVLEHVKTGGVILLEIELRVRRLDALARRWTNDVAASGLSIVFGTVNVPSAVHAPGSPGSPDDGVEEALDITDQPDEERDDDSAILSSEEEDEPDADQLDDLADAAGSSDGSRETSDMLRPAWRLAADGGHPATHHTTDPLGGQAQGEWPHVHLVRGRSAVPAGLCRAPGTKRH